MSTCKLENFDRFIVPANAKENAGLADIWAKFQVETTLEDVDCGKEVERPRSLSTSVQSLSEFYTINNNTVSSGDAIGFYRLLMNNDSEGHLLDRGRELYVLNDSSLYSFSGTIYLPLTL